MKPMSLEEALDAFQVVFRWDHAPQDVLHWNPGMPFGVSTPKGMVAVFVSEQAACHYRMILVNQAMNPDWSNACE